MKTDHGPRVPGFFDEGRDLWEDVPYLDCIKRTGERKYLDLHWAILVDLFSGNISL